MSGGPLQSVASFSDFKKPSPQHPINLQVTTLEMLNQYRQLIVNTPNSKAFRTDCGLRAQVIVYMSSNCQSTLNTEAQRRGIPAPGTLGLLRRVDAEPFGKFDVGANCLSVQRPRDRKQEAKSG